MRSRSGFVISAAVVMLLAWASPAMADMVPSFPDPYAPETGPMLAVAVAFVIVVSGLSLFLLRKMARSGGADEPRVETEQETHHE